MSLYADQQKKISYYYSRIIQDLAQKGIYPDNDRIQKQISNIDSMLGIFQYTNVGRSEEFDTKKFNEDMLRIWQDLKILYELALEITVKDYEELQIWCETYLTELQNMAKRYRYKTSTEMEQTYLGTTILHQSSGFDINNNNGVVTINLGDISVEAGAKLFCIFEAENVSSQNIIFRLIDKDNDILSCSPYNYNHDFITVPGTLNKNTYSVSLNGMNVRTSFFCTPESLSGKLSYNNKYKLYGGKDFMSFNYVNKLYAKKVVGVPVDMPEGGIVTFFILDSTYVNFEFSTEPKHKNFDGTVISEPLRCQKIVIEHDSNISFDFVTDGTIYATCVDGIITNGELVYPTADQVDDIMIEEYCLGNNVTYNISVKITNISGGNVPIIQNIAIKQLSALEVIS